jgi:hypothetical protein
MEMLAGKHNVQSISPPKLQCHGHGRKGVMWMCVIPAYPGPDGELPEEIRGMEPKLVEKVGDPIKGGGLGRDSRIAAAAADNLGLHLSKESSTAPSSLVCQCLAGVQ